MELRRSTVLVTGVTGNTGPSVTDVLGGREADVVGTDVTEPAGDTSESHAERVDAVGIARSFLAVTPPTHAFWTVDEPKQRHSELTNFPTNATLFGAALVLLALGGTDWPYAFDISL